MWENCPDQINSRDSSLFTRNLNFLPQKSSFFVFKQRLLYWISWFTVVMCAYGEHICTFKPRPNRATTSLDITQNVKFTDNHLKIRARARVRAKIANFFPARPWTICDHICDAREHPTNPWFLILLTSRFSIYAKIALPNFMFFGFYSENTVASDYRISSIFMVLWIADMHVQTAFRSDDWFRRYDEKSKKYP